LDLRITLIRSNLVNCMKKYKILFPQRHGSSLTFCYYEDENELSFLSVSPFGESHQILLFTICITSTFTKVEALRQALAKHARITSVKLREQSSICVISMVFITNSLLNK